MFSQKGIQRHPVKEWNEREVYRWLKQKGLSKLWRHFRDKKLDGKLLLQTTGQYLDRLGVSNPTTRDKLLAAVHELKLFGGPVPDERQFRLNVPGNNNNGISPRTKKRSLPERPPGNAHLFLKEILNEGTPSSRGIEVVERKTPQEVLHEQNDQMCQEVEKGEVLVHTAGLQFDMEDITIEITNHTTSKELVSLLLAQCKADSKDPNLFYIAVETGMQKKDSSLPISQMMVLADDDRPLEIQSRQPSGEAKLHLKMRSGGLLRVQAGILSPGATYKCVQISRQTRADEVVKMILSGYGSDEPPEKFVLVESLSDSEVGRILEADECPLEVQSQWELGEQRTFTLTLAEFEGVLQSEDKDVSLSGETDATQQSSTDYDKNNEDQPMNSSSSEIEEKETTEQIRRRRTSIDALDLQLSQINQVNEVNQVKRKVSQIDNLRHKFQEYHRKPSSVTAVDETAISGSGEGPKRRKVSQIDRFRSKFLEYAQNSGKGETGAHNTIDEEVKDGDNASRKKTPPSRVSSDSEELPRFSSSPPSHLRNNNNHNDVLRENEKNCGNRLEDSVDKNSKSNRLSLASVLKHSKLVTVTLNKQPGEGWGLELVHVTRTGSPMSQHDNDAIDDEKVVYVLHSGNGQNSIVGTSSAADSSGDLFSPSGISTPHSQSSSGSSEHEITSILGTSSLADKSQDMRHILHKQSLKRRKIGTCNQHVNFPALSPILSRPGSAPAGGEINPLPQRPSSAFAQWSKDGSPQPRPGVRIVALTEGGVAATSGELAVDDLIVEIDGKFLLNSPLEPVIAALQETNTVTIVVARAQAPDTKSEEKENVTDCKEDIKALTLQIQNLVTKVSEMQNDLKKKDDKIKSLKKMVRKNSADSKGKIYQSVQVLV